MEPTTLTPEPFDHLALVFKEYKGAKWGQRNQSSRVLAVKGAAEEVPARPSMLQRFANSFKGWYLPEGAAVPDKIDGDGDGAEDYDQIAQILATAFNDLSASFGLYGDASRTAAVVASIDTFLANLDDIRTGGEGMVAKAGKKHSAETLSRLTGMRAELDRIISGDPEPIAPATEFEPAVEVVAEVKGATIEPEAIPAVTVPVEVPIVVEIDKAAVLTEVLASDAFASAIAAMVAKALPAPPAPVDLSPLTSAIESLANQVRADKASTDAKLAEVAATANGATATLAAVVGKAAIPTATGGLSIVQADGSTTVHPATQEPVKKASPKLAPGSSTLMQAINAQRYAVGA